MSKFRIAPSILSADFSRLKDELCELELAGADAIHIDVMDGHFVPNLTIGPCVIQSLRSQTKLPFITHLMIDEPQKYLEAFVKAGSDAIIIHVESQGKTKETLKQIKSFDKVQVGISLRPGTPLEEIEPYLNILDIILVMTVEPGFGGQKFMKDQVSKIKRLSELQKNFNFKIEVDGGVNEETVQHCKGCDTLIVGSYLFKGAEKNKNNEAHYKKIFSSLNLKGDQLN